MRLSEAIPQYERQLAANSRSAHTRAAYLRNLHELSRWLGEGSTLSTINPDHLARFLISDLVLCTSSGEPRAAISVNRTNSGLRSFFAFCVESRLIKKNPTRLIRSSPARAKEPSTLEPGEIERIRAVLAEKTGALADRFARSLDQPGITRPFSTHSLRHTFATRLYRKTGGLYLVQRALGHRQITTTEIYARVSDDALRKAVGID